MSGSTNFRRGREAIEEAAAVPAPYAIAYCGWGFDVLRDGLSVAWISYGETPELPPEYREPGFTVYRDEWSSEPLAESADLAGALGHLFPAEVASELALGIVGRDSFEVETR